jgi:hypothetical protein
MKVILTIDWVRYTVRESDVPEVMRALLLLRKLNGEKGATKESYLHVTMEGMTPEEESAVLFERPSPVPKVMQGEV